MTSAKFTTRGKTAVGGLKVYVLSKGKVHVVWTFVSVINVLFNSVEQNSSDFNLKFLEVSKIHTAILHVLCENECRVLSRKEEPSF